MRVLTENQQKSKEQCTYRAADAYSKDYIYDAT